MPEEAKTKAAEKKKRTRGTRRARSEREYKPFWLIVRSVATKSVARAILIELWGSF